jgi:riboflavin kinase
VYYGFVGLQPPSPSSSSPSSPSSSSPITTYPAVLSIGYNPFYANSTRSVEIHILHDFSGDFYGAGLNLLILGFIRPEYDYVSVEALVGDIRIDCDVAKRSLQRDGYARWEREEGWLREFAWRDGVDAEQTEKEVLKKDGEELS